MNAGLPQVKGSRETQNGKTMDVGYCQKPWLSFERVSLQMLITSKITNYKSEPCIVRVYDGTKTMINPILCT